MQCWFTLKHSTALARLAFPKPSFRWQRSIVIMTNSLIMLAQVAINVVSTFIAGAQQLNSSPSCHCCRPRVTSAAVAQAVQDIPRKDDAVLKAHICTPVTNKLSNAACFVGVRSQRATKHRADFRHRCFHRNCTDSSSSLPCRCCRARARCSCSRFAEHHKMSLKCHKNNEISCASVAEICQLLRRCPRVTGPQRWCRARFRCASAAEAVQGGARAAEQGYAVLQAELQRPQASPQNRGDAQCLSSCCALKPGCLFMMHDCHYTLNFEALDGIAKEFAQRARRLL